MHDLRLALRAFARTPGASALVVATLAVAIAVATVAASTIDMVWRFIPAVRTDRLVFVASTDPRPELSQAGVADGLARTGVSIPDLVDWSARTSSFDTFAAFTFESAVVTGREAPSRVFRVQASPNFLDVWGIRPQAGRDVAAEEGTPGRNGAVIVSHGYWQQQLSAADDVLGQVLTIDARPHTIVGVLPQSASTGIFRTVELLTPLVLDRERARRDDRRLYVTAVLKEGVDLDRAEADLAAAARQLQADYPATNAQTGVVVRPLMELLGANINAVVFLLSLVAAIIFFIACANVSSIILSHAVTRRRELAVRSALGAGRSRHIRQFIVESLVTSSIAGAAGLMLAWWGAAAVRASSPNAQGFSEIALNGRVLGAGLAVTLIAPLGFALLPALRMSRPDMDELRQGARGAETPKSRRLRESLVVVQVALALVLMTQVGLIGRATWKIHHAERGFDPAQLLTLRMSLAESEYPAMPGAHDFFTRALERIQALPGVVSSGTIDRLPIADRETSVRFAIQGMPAPSPDSQPQAARAAVSAGYMQTMRIPVIRGRGLARTDFAGAPPVAVITREAAHRFWPGQDPVGMRIAFDGEPDWFEIVGIAGDVRNSNAGSRPAPQVYVPSSSRPSRDVAFVVRTSGPDPAQLAPAIRRELRSSTSRSPSTMSGAWSACSWRISAERMSLRGCSPSLRPSRCCLRQRACTG